MRTERGTRRAGGGRGVLEENAGILDQSGPFGLRVEPAVLEEGPTWKHPSTFYQRKER